MGIHQTLSEVHLKPGEKGLGDETGMGGTLICLSHVLHVIQNSWRPLCDPSHSGNYISECSDHIST